MRSTSAEHTYVEHLCGTHLARNRVRSRQNALPLNALCQNCVAAPLKEEHNAMRS